MPFTQFMFMCMCLCVFVCVVHLKQNAISQPRPGAEPGASRAFSWVRACIEHRATRPVSHWLYIGRCSYVPFASLSFMCLSRPRRHRARGLNVVSHRSLRMPPQTLHLRSLRLCPVACREEDKDKTGRKNWDNLMTWLFTRYQGTLASYNITAGIARIRIDPTTNK